MEVARKMNGGTSAELRAALNNIASLKNKMGDVEGAIEAQNEALAISYRLDPNDDHNGVVENNLGTYYMKAQGIRQSRGTPESRR